MNLIYDFREPYNLRFELTPLYTTFGDVWEGLDRIRRVVEAKRYLKFPSERQTVI